MKEPTVKMIRITSKKDGFRRCGIAHYGSRIYPQDAFREEELMCLLVEPMLVVDVVDVPDEPEKREGKAGGGAVGAARLFSEGEAGSAFGGPAGEEPPAA